MRLRFATLAALLALTGAALAAELSSDLDGLIEGFQAHRRVALGYLRTQNGELAAVEIERLRDRLAVDRGKIAPRALTDMPFVIALARTESLVDASLKAADGGDIDRAQSLLYESRQPLADWRQTKDIRLFSDCIAEISAAYGPLDGHRQSAPDLADAATSARIVTSTKSLLATLERCDREAGERLRQEPGFRRLFDGMAASLRQIQDAVAARDGALLHRLLIEQRSFEQMLSFRFG
jgi:hypothetical protein